MTRLALASLLLTLAACHGKDKPGSGLEDGEVAFEHAFDLPAAYPEVREVYASPSGEFVAVAMGEGLYVTDSTGWHQVAAGGYTAVSNSGSVFSLSDAGLTRTNAAGQSDVLDVGPFFQLGQRSDNVRTGADGSVWVSGSETLNGTPTVWRSMDDGDTWQVTSVARSDFNGGAQITGAFYVRDDGVLFSMRGGATVRRSADDGVTWTDVPNGLPSTPIDSTTIAQVNNDGDFCRSGHTVFEGFDSATETYVRAPKEGLPISPSQGGVTLGCAIDDDGTMYFMATILAGSGDAAVQGGTILQYDGSWSEVAVAPSHGIYRGTSVQVDDDGLIVGSGLEGVAHITTAGAVTTSAPPEATTGPIRARRLVAVGDDVVLVVRVGGSTAGAVNATTPAMLRIEGGVVTTMDVRASDALRVSNGNIFAYSAGQLRVSTDTGLTFGNPIAAEPPDPLELNNLIRTDARLMVQQGDEVHIRVYSLKGGVNGLYNDHSRIVTDLDGNVLETRERDVNLAASTDPLITGAEGEVGYWLHPGYYLDFVGQQPIEYFVSEQAFTVGGTFDGPMPVAGSDNGYFVAFLDDGMLSIGSPGDERLFEPAVPVFADIAPDAMPTLLFTESSVIQSAPPEAVEFPLVGFDPDGRLYFADPASGRVYSSVGVF